MHDSVTVKFNQEDRKERYFRKQNIHRPLLVEYKGVFVIVVTSEGNTHSFPSTDVSEVVTTLDSRCQLNS